VGHFSVKNRIYFMFELEKPFIFWKDMQRMGG